MYVKSLSQEHGIIRAGSGDLQKIREGDVLGVLPVHSCLTADCMGKYLSTDDKIISRFRYNA
jgi:D-serine deaminase-like pyridoxal phosphate-dependent protein